MAIEVRPIWEREAIFPALTNENRKISRPFRLRFDRKMTPAYTRPTMRVATGQQVCRGGRFP